MTIAAFQKHLQNQGCTLEPLDKPNITGTCFRVTNPNPLRKHFWNIYKGGEVSDTEAMTICDALLIRYPPNLIDFTK